MRHSSTEYFVILKYRRIGAIILKSRIEICRKLHVGSTCDLEGMRLEKEVVVQVVTIEEAEDPHGRQ